MYLEKSGIVLQGIWKAADQGMQKCYDQKPGERSTGNRDYEINLRYGQHAMRRCGQEFHSASIGGSTL